VLNCGPENRTDAAPLMRSSIANPSPKRIRRKALVKVDRRTVAGRRVSELRTLFLASLEAQGRDMTAGLMMKVDQAAQLQAFAEAARGRYLRSEGNDRIDAIATCERLARDAVRALRLVDGPTPKVGTALADRLAALRAP
jgi:hypothetical protein